MNYRSLKLLLAWFHLSLSPLNSLLNHTYVCMCILIVSWSCTILRLFMHACKLLFIVLFFLVGKLFVKITWVNFGCVQCKFRPHFGFRTRSLDLSLKVFHFVWTDPIVTDMIMYPLSFCFLHSKQDIELMCMRYALESAILALKAMERSVAGERESHLQEPFCFLKDLQSHLEAITNIPRKVIWFAIYWNLSTLCSGLLKFWFLASSHLHES